MSTPEQVQAAVRATPAVRATAASAGVDLTRVRGTGVAGRITVGDVRAAAEPAQQARVAAAQQAEDSFRFATDVGRWPTGSATLDAQLRDSPRRLYDVTARVAAGPTRPAAAASEPLAQPKQMTYGVNFDDGAAPAGVGSAPAPAVPYSPPAVTWFLDDAARLPAARPQLYLRGSADPDDGTE